VQERDEVLVGSWSVPVTEEYAGLKLVINAIKALGGAAVEKWSCPLGDVVVFAVTLDGIHLEADWDHWSGSSLVGPIDEIEVVSAALAAQLDREGLTASPARVSRERSSENTVAVHLSFSDRVVWWHKIPQGGGCLRAPAFL
jgi:hypothetical protein